MRRFLSFAALLLAGCATTIEQPSATQVTTAVVAARGETVPVGTANADAADDPAIWRNHRNPNASLIVATDKKAGLYVYGLDGRVRSFVTAGQVNNVDLLDLGRDGVLVVASDRNDVATAKLQMYRLDTIAGKLVALGSAPGGAGEGYGVCLWRSGSDVFAFSVLKEGAVHQVRLDPRAGSGTIVRTLRVATQPEGCVVDPRSAQLYVGEEAAGIWRFDARRSAPTGGELVARVDTKRLFADVEGLALAPRGRTGGYLVASSQGDNAYVVYSLPDVRFVGRFRIGPGRFDGTEETDGIGLVLGDFGPQYPGGLLVVQDGLEQPAEGGERQNFKLVAWRDVKQALQLK
ncbi:phytase [Sphingomonas arenae]|uniref:phytase n=1 Tax=Sphingomonas arenae TaxID=2812555 RepID=UPI0019676744|nr:phytase [Sphingomonas arenae]